MDCLWFDILILPIALPLCLGWELMLIGLRLLAPLGSFVGTA